MQLAKKVNTMQARDGAQREPLTSYSEKVLLKSSQKVRGLW